MVARCGCLRAHHTHTPPPRPDVSVAPRMRGRRPCHSNRSVNGSNGNGGSLQCRGGRRALRGGGWPGGCSGGRGLGERLSGGVPGTQRRQLGEGGEGTTTGACSGREGGGGGAAGWSPPLARRGEAEGGPGLCERRPLRAAAERPPGRRLWQRGAEPFAVRASPELVSGAEQPGQGTSWPEGSPVLGALAEAGVWGGCVAC